ncbi:aminodeoxychorismate synthase component I [Oceanicoccus sagamiensis]|uniref:aminodeoxychorismate synthase n=1 Tax=Oceanicoccus sagamiensis TaxID=716816 RepID=A0A1X9NQI2_9GAMM|nr:aminodeoxychorismate synthase component I [Oceanicoccus sagamiensis]ARN76083.1 aminodeoxychorismate synthase, component I [Oceanicoccus sagamiensis]
MTYQLTIEELPYQVDSALLFARFLDMEQPVYLDSAAAFSARGRYDIFSAQPLSTLQPKKEKATNSDSYDFFSDIKQALNALTPSINNDYHLPFVGGALGYFGYDLGRQLETLPKHALKDLSLADASIGIYSWAVIIDHRQQRALLVAHPSTDASLLQEIRSRLKAGQIPALDRFSLKTDFQSNMTKTEYSAAYSQVQRYIESGDCYQINLAQRFSAEYSGHPWDAYLALRQTAAAPFSAYIQQADSTILSLSPERLLHSSNRRVTTSPIKGTIGRGQSRVEDEGLAQQLLNSAKDRAENLMIVDLLRNDLGKSCEPGSIQVDELFELQSFETVHHLVSTIRGQLSPDKDALDLLAGCFPGGSITGAPKIRAMEIIEELEPHRRSVYCGAIGYISCDGQMDTNIAIRTMVCEDDKIHCWAGGGIVADSQCEGEYQECMTKVGRLLATLEQPNKAR